MAFPILAPFAGIIAWLGTFFTSFTTVVTTIAAIRFAVALALSAAWTLAFFAFVEAIRALLPTPGTGAGGSLVAEFMAWLAFLKPAGLDAYISAIITAWIFTQAFRMVTKVITIRAAS